MSTRSRLPLAGLLALLSPVDLSAAGPPAPPLSVLPGDFELAGLRQRRQLLVTLRGADATRTARYATSPPGIVTVSPEGLVRPLGKGSATITITAGKLRASLRVRVRDTGGALHFANDIVPLL